MTTNTIIGYIKTGSYPASIGQFIVDIPALPPITPIADFSTKTVAGESPFCIHFTDNSQNTDYVTWDFTNDGVVDSVESNLRYVYRGPGEYCINMTAVNENGTDSIKKYIYID